MIYINNITKVIITGTIERLKNVDPKTTEVIAARTGSTVARIVNGAKYPYNLGPRESCEFKNSSGSIVRQ